MIENKGKQGWMEDEVGGGTILLTAKVKQTQG